LPFGLHREIDDGRRAAVRRRDGAGVEIIGRRRAAERQLHVRVRVDAAGDDQPPFRVDDAIGVRFDRARDHRHGAVLDEDVGVIVVDGGDDAAIPNHCFHANDSILGPWIP
jgi:hypothetical protein